MDFHNIGDRLTKKLGPLPLYAWALIIVGVGYVAYRYVGRGASAAVSPASVAAPDATSSAAEDSTGSYGSPDTGSAGGGGVSLPSADTNVPATSDYSAPDYSNIYDLLAGYFDSSAGIGLGSYGQDEPVPTIANNAIPTTSNVQTPIGTSRPGPNGKMNMWNGTKWVPVENRPTGATAARAPSKPAASNSATHVNSTPAKTVAQIQNVGVKIGTVRNGPNGKPNRWNGSRWVPVK